MSASLGHLASHIARQPDGCWNWTGALDRDGYGRASEKRAFEKRQTRRAHRVIYQQLKGPIPDGLELDHLCGNKSCVNPDHLEPVTRLENQRRYAASAGPRPLLSHCRFGHPYDAENTYLLPNGKRACRACACRRQKSYQKRRQLSGVAP